MANVSSSNGLEKRPKLRFPGFDEPWRVERLSDFADRVTRKNSQNQTDLPLTISSKDGLVDQVSYFNKTVASKDMSGYYLLLNGEYAYNKSYSVGYDFGSIKRLDRYPMGALSTLYICFALKKHYSDFIKAYFDSLKWYREIYMISAEGARNHGLLNVPTDEFFETKHYLPQNLNEQRKIADFIIALDHRIDAQQSLVDNLKKYKRGLHEFVFLKNRKASWEKAALKNIASFCGGGTPSKDISSYWNGNIGWISSSDIQDEWIDDISVTRRITNSAIDNSATKICPKGTIAIVSRVGVGKVAVMPECLCTSQDFTNITSITGNTHYMAYQIAFKMKIEAIKTQGTSIKGVTGDTIKSMVMDIPTLEEQEHIAELLSTFDLHIKRAIRNLDILLVTKKALLQQLFI